MYYGHLKCKLHVNIIGFEVILYEYMIYFSSTKNLTRSEFHAHPHAHGHDSVVDDVQRRYLREFLSQNEK